MSTYLDCLARFNEKEYFPNFKQHLGDSVRNYLENRIGHNDRTRVLFYDRYDELDHFETMERFSYVQQYYGGIFDIVCYFREVADGCSTLLHNRYVLKQMMDFARREKIKTILMPCVATLIQPEDFCPHGNFSAPLLNRDIRRLEAMGTQSFSFVPLIDPGTDKKEAF